MNADELATSGRITSVDEARTRRVPDIGVHQLLEHGRYVHVDVTVKNLSDGVTAWAKSRFKMRALEGVASLEFRRGRTWPDFFDSTVVFQTDSYGEALQLDKAAIEHLSAQRLGPENELKLRALLENLVSIAERSARMANMQSPSRQEWLEGLKALAAAGGRRGTGELDAASPLLKAAPADADAAETFDRARRTGFDDVRVNQLLEQGSYVHIDVTVMNLSDGAQVWPEIRFKMRAHEGVVSLEFRRGPTWPDFFDPTVAFQTDSYGEALQLDKGAIEHLSAQRLGPENESKLRALLENLVSIAERSARMANMQSPSRQEWLEGLKALAKSKDGSAEE